VGMALRPSAPAKRGKPTAVVGNHFKIKLVGGFERDLCHYRLDIQPEVLLKTINRLVVEKLVADQFADVSFAYDGRFDAYTPQPIAVVPAVGDEKTFEVTLPPAAGRREGRPFQVTVKLVDTVPLGALKDYLDGKLETHQRPILQLQALEIALQQHMLKTFVAGGRKFYTEDFFKKTNIGGGLELWKGFYQSVRLVQSGLSLNFDVSNTAFLKPMKVLAYLREVLGPNFVPNGSAMERKAILRAKPYIIKTSMMLDHTKHQLKKRCVGFSEKGADETFFDLRVSENGARERGEEDVFENISVLDYYTKHRNIKIQFPKLPCLGFGTAARPVWVPMELCSIAPKQRFVGKLTGDQTAKVIKAVIQRPEDRFKDNIRLMKMAHGDPAADKFATDFGVEMDLNPTTVQARLLPPPQLAYQKNAMEQPKFPGQWNMTAGRRFHEGGFVEAIVGIVFEPSVKEGDMSGFLKIQIAKLQQLGVNVHPKNCANPPVVRGNINNVQASFKAACEKLPPGLKYIPMIVCAIPDDTSASSVKGDLKFTAETILGVGTQCILAKNVKKYSKIDERGGDQFHANVALKINVKTGGRNFCINIAKCLQSNLAKDPTIFFGADVTHPAPGSTKYPSVAAVVGSMDWPFLTKYGTLTAAQVGRQENISAMHDPETNSGMIVSLLKGFYFTTKRKPERIVMFRDGVSEGQFAPVLNEELSAIRAACNSLQEGYCPPITYVVVTKRHNTRFMCQNPRDADKSGNIVSGTVVDQQICDARTFEFFLCSHAGLQGTSCPAHYHVLHDQNNFTVDSMQELCYNMTYTYQRCTRAVSIPPPVYYAHLAAFRARLYLGMDKDFSDSDTASMSDSGVQALPTPKESSFGLGRPGQMYYM